jgi:hypothetical protein
LHPWNEANLITVYDFLNMLLNSACKYFNEDFYTMFIMEIVPWFYFYVVSLSNFAIKIILCRIYFKQFFPFLLNGIVWGALVLVL